MKIAIVSLYGNVNYGNKLQNFALQEMIKKYGHEVFTFENTMAITSKRLHDIRMTKNLPKSLFSYSKWLFKNRFNKENKKEIGDKRTKKITDFNKKINKSKFALQEVNYPEIIDAYDIFVFGSDQVWNPQFIHNFEVNLGTFVPKEKKVAYGASFGIDSLNNKQKRFYKKALEEFNSKKISVREEQGNRIISDLIGEDVEIVLDPTMLLKKEEWCKLTKEPEVLPNKAFILTYILGELNEEREIFLNNFASKYNYEIINLMDKSTLEYNSGVEEFLWYFNNADFVFADSFHAGVFSILFEKPFYIMDRKDSGEKMNSRFDTLLKTFQLKDRYLKSYDIDNIRMDINYENVHRILDIKREESLVFLGNLFGEDKDRFY